MNTENYPNFLVYSDWLVPLEIAKQLKEIGFNGKCEAYIRDEELSPIYTKAPKKDYNLNCDTISIPSYVQIFDWFEEVKILTAKENTFFKFLIENIEKEKELSEHKKAILNFKIAELIENTKTKKKNNNYPEWLVSLDIAEELKKIGFDEPCEYFFNTFDNEIRNYGITENYNDDPTAHFSVPSYEQVFKWFRKKKLIGLIGLDLDYEKPYYYVIENEKGNTMGHIPAFNTYEEAREALVLDLIDTCIFIEEEKHCLVSFYHNKQYGTGSLVVMQVGGEIKISDKEELQQIWETLKEDPKLYFEALFDTDYISYKSSKMFRFKEEKGKEGTPKAIIDLINKIMKEHNYSFDNNDLEAHYFDFSFPELYYEQLNNPIMTKNHDTHRKNKHS